MKLAIITAATAIAFSSPAFAHAICDHFEMIGEAAAAENITTDAEWPEYLDEGNVWIQEGTGERFETMSNDEEICLVHIHE